DHEQEVISRQNPGGARLLKKKMHSVLSMGRRFEREKENFLDFPQEEEAILAKFDPSIHLPAGKTVLDYSLDVLKAGERVLARNLRLYVTGKEHIGIIGRNGAGKSTLLKGLWQELKDRRDIHAMRMPQDYSEVLDFDKTPIQYLAEHYTKDEVTKARTYMGGMKFTHEEMTGKIGSLSGGQKAKILFLDMVLQRADVLLLDEPTRNFSPLSSPVVRASLAGFGGAVISVSHDRKYLEEVCDKVYELREDGLVLTAKA
nr:ATP-binding cassette domain-containing protein [Lachnospiraceae bacterium]